MYYIECRCPHEKGHFWGVWSIDVHSKAYDFVGWIKGWAVQKLGGPIFGLIANLKGPYFQPVCLSVCLCVCVSDRHFYPSTLTDFDEIWSQGPYCDLVWPRP